MGRKTYNRGEVVNAADVMTYFMNQANMTFATAAARSAAITSPTQGMVTWRNDAAGPVKLEYYSAGGSWTALSLSSPAHTVQGQNNVQASTTASLAGSTAANTYSSWTSVATSPSGTNYLTEVMLTGLAGFTSGTIYIALVELSLDAGSTVWRRFMLPMVGSLPLAGLSVTPRSASSSSTVHMRFKLAQTAPGGGVSLGISLGWTATAPAITLSAAESLWESTSAGTTYGTWNTLGTVGAAHRLCSVMAASKTDFGLGTGATPTTIARWRGTGSGSPELFYGGNRAVPSGSLKASGYDGSLIWVLTEAV